MIKRIVVLLEVLSKMNDPLYMLKCPGRSYLARYTATLATSRDCSHITWSRRNPASVSLLATLCRRHSDYLSERKSESNAILWKITNEEIRNESARRIEVILEDKNYSRSSQSKNLTLSRFVHFKNDDKISFRRNEMFEDFVCESASNQWKFRKFRSI
jgi:hypothetical protein